MDPLPPDSLPSSADPTWFRPPTRREHAIAAALFLGFALFFISLFVLQHDKWWRWLFLALALFSAVRGLRHVISILSRQ